MISPPAFGDEITEAVLGWNNGIIKESSFPIKDLCSLHLICTTTTAQTACIWLPIFRHYYTTDEPIVLAVLQLIQLVGLAVTLERKAWTMVSGTLVQLA